MLPSTTFGERLRVIEAAGLRVIEARHAAGLRLPRHCHENANVTLVLGGGFEEVVQQRAYYCRPSTALLKPAGAQHFDRYGKQGAHSLILEFGCDFLSSFDGIQRLLAEQTCWRGGAGNALGLQIYEEVREPDSTSAIMVESLALQLLVETGRWKEITERSPQPPAWLCNARDYVNASFRNELRLHDVASVAGVHAVHLSKSFKRYFGTTVGNYVRQQRLQFAAQLLTDTSLPLSRIAVEAGFCDQSHFTNVFRRAMRSAPGSFRRSSRRNSPL